MVGDILKHIFSSWYILFRSIRVLFSRCVFTGDLVAFFKRCKSGLNPTGMIFVKENIAKKSSSVDDVDHSVTR